MNSFNDLINQANQMLTCGPACMQNQKTSQLEENYIDAETNMVNAPQKVYLAKKELITYKDGESGYNEYIDKELISQADAIASAYQEKFNTDINNIQNSINTYKGLFVNLNNVFDLFKKYELENKELEKTLKIKSSDILTNDRKTFYEDEGIGKLKTYYYIFLFIYIFVVIVFLLSTFLVKTSVKISTRIFILFLMIIYPFICYILLEILKYIYTHIKYFFSSNVYRNM
jgi:hypothetical protein